MKIILKCSDYFNHFQEKKSVIVFSKIFPGTPINFFPRREQFEEFWKVLQFEKVFAGEHCMIAQRRSIDDAVAVSCCYNNAYLRIDFFELKKISCPLILGILRSRINASKRFFFLKRSTAVKPLCTALT